MTTARAVFDWTRAVMRDPDLSGAAKTVAWCLAEHASRNAVAWPKIETVAAEVAMHETNARKHVHALRDARYLVIEDRRHLREASWYWLALEGRTLGDLQTPPRPRGSAPSKLDGERVDVLERPSGSAQSNVAPYTARANEQGGASRPSGSAQSPDRVDPRGRTRERPSGSAPSDRVDPLRATERNHSVPSKEDPPNRTAHGTQEAPAPRSKVVESEPDAYPDRTPDRRIRGALVRGYAERYLAATKLAWMSHGAAAAKIDTAALWCATVEDPMQAVELVLDAAFADSWMREHRWPWGSIANDPAKYFEAGRKAAWLADREKRREAAKRQASQGLDAEHERRREEAVECPDDVRAEIDAWMGRLDRGEPEPETTAPIAHRDPKPENVIEGEPPAELHEVAQALGRAGRHPIVVRGQRTTPLEIAAALPLPALRRARDTIAARQLSEMDVVQVLTGASA